MKQIIFFTFLLAAVFVASFALARKLDEKVQAPIRLAVKHEFKPASNTLKNHPFTFVIVGYNNGAGVAKTLSSVFSQMYENYRVVYIDDASNDGSFELARDLIYESSHLGQVTLVQNDKRLGALANVARAVQGCSDQEIVVILEGEDFLAHEWVLQRLNAYYADPDLWLTYGQYRQYPSFEVGPSREVLGDNLRSEPFVASHLKTFYAALFKRVKESDFVFGGTYLPAMADLAYMIPMLELAKGHSHFIKETLYIQNNGALYPEDRELQMRCEKFVRSLDPYQPLSYLQVNSCGD